MSHWQVGAVVVQVAGMLVTSWGIRATWVAHPTGERFLAPLVNGWRAFTRRIAGVARRVFRRPVRGTAHAVAGRATVTATGSVGATVWRALPTDADAFHREVNAHLSRLTLESLGHANALAAEASARDQAVADVRAAVDFIAEELRTEVHQAATEGLREQTVGLFLVALGLVFQVLAGG